MIPAISGLLRIPSFQRENSIILVAEFWQFLTLPISLERMRTTCPVPHDPRASNARRATPDLIHWAKVPPF